MDPAPPLAAHCWVCEKYARCSCTACTSLRDTLREARAEAEREETVDLGSFAQYADEEPVTYAQVVGGGLVRVTAKEA